jgi:flagellar M-ring protein FliF
MALSPIPRSNDLTPMAQGGLMGQVQNVPAMLNRFTAQPAIRRALPSLLIVALAAVALLGWLALREAPRTPLYPGLAEAEKARVMEALTAAGIDARVERATGEVSVPTADYHTARLALASQGLPQAVPTGNQALSEIPLGASRSLETARLRQSHELELARSITEIGAIQAARVHLALPERSAFLRDNHPPRASVFVTLAAGRALDAGQVEAIVHLVSSSVPGMARADVSVVDQTGRLLSRGDETDSTRLAERHLRHQVELETLLRRRIEALLTPIVGFGNFSVEVTAAMDFTRRDIREERVDPNGNALRSEQLTENESGDLPAGGIPGAVTNTPPTEAELTEQAPAGETATSANRTRSSASTRNFEVSRTISTTQPETGTLQRLSTAIVLRAPDLSAADPAAAEAQAAMVQSLQGLVESAIGHDAGRGDVVTIMVHPFATPMADEAPSAGMMQQYIAYLPDVLNALVVIAVVAVIGLGILRPLLQRQLQAVESQPAAAYAPGMVEVAAGESLAQVEEKLNQRHRQLAQSVLGNNASRLDKQAVLQQLAKDDPARVASVLHRMIRPELDSTG